ncbi:hypothetical protein IAT40_007998 [Kwoniella sp. CBS 6097]
MTPPTVLACGSNAASHLAINHPDDVSILTPTIYHPSILPQIPSSAKVIDLVSTSAHSLLLLSVKSDGPGNVGKNVLLGAGTNTFGQLGPRCALWDNVKPEPRWKVLSNLTSSAGLQEGEWEPVKIAATWTTSLIVYQRVRTQDQPSAQASSTSSTTATAASGSGSSRLRIDQQADGEGEAGTEQVVISTGSNDFGELGSTTSTPLTLGTDAPAPIPIASASRNPTIVDLGLKVGERVEMIKGGQRHVITVIDGLTGQRVIGWGASRKGELDAATLSSIHTASSSNSGSMNSTARTAASAKGKGKGKATARPPFLPPTAINLSIPPNERILDISLGASHSLALISEGTVLAWGSDQKGQITDVHEMRGVKGIAASWGGSYFLTDDEAVWTQGSNSHSQLLRGSAVESETDNNTASRRGKVPIPDGWEVQRIVAGSEHLLVHAKKRKPAHSNNDENGRGSTKEEEALFSGGWNEHGNLGLGDQQDRNTLQKVNMDLGINGGLGQGTAARIKGLWGGCASTWIWVDQDGHD